MEIAVKENLLTHTIERYTTAIPATSIHKLATMADQAYFPHGSVILDLDQPQTHFYLIIDGVARSYAVDPDGNEVVKNFMLDGDFLLGESLFAEKSTEAFDALADLHALRFNASAVKPLLMADPGLTAFYVTMLEATFRYKMAREYGFQKLDATARYRQFQELFGQAEKRLPQNQIASYIGITKESLSRLRKKLADR